MAQKQNMLFNIPKRRDNTKKILEKTKGIDTQPKALNITSANRLEQVIQVAKQLLVRRDNLDSITDLNEIYRYIDKIKENGYVAVDTETTGKNVMSDKVVGLCLYTPGEKGIYIPSLHRSHMTNEVRDGQVSVDDMTKILTAIENTGAKQIYHHYKFDARMIYNNYGLWMTGYWDTFLCSIILNENERHSLKVLHGKYVAKDGEDNLKYDELFEDFDFGLIPLDIAKYYAGYDPIMTFELFKFQEEALNRPHLEGLKNTFTTIEMPLVPVVARMEQTGNAIDFDHAEYLETKYTKLMDVALDNVNMEISKYEEIIVKFKKKRPDVSAKLDNPLNVGSPTQLAVLLYDILGLKSSDRKKPRGTGKAILKDMDIPLTNAILDHRTIGKLMSTYILKLPKCVDPRTGRLHGTFNQGGTDTGRFSSNSPNLQNIPSKNKEIRRLFKAPEGYVMIGGDYSYLTSWL